MAWHHCPSHPQPRHPSLQMTHLFILLRGNKTPHLCLSFLPIDHRTQTSSPMDVQIWLLTYLLWCATLPHSFLWKFHVPPYFAELTHFLLTPELHLVERNATVSEKFTDFCRFLVHVIITCLFVRLLLWQRHIYIYAENVHFCVHPFLSLSPAYPYISIWIKIYILLQEQWPVKFAGWHLLIAGFERTHLVDQQVGVLSWVCMACVLYPLCALFFFWSHLPILR